MLPSIQSEPVFEMSGNVIFPPLVDVERVDAGVKWAFHRVKIERFDVTVGEVDVLEIDRLNTEKHLCS